jgi:hypothetical protein
VNKGGLTAAFAGFALVVMGVLPPFVLDDTYGDVAVPGSATVHLPSGEMDVTLEAVAPTDDRSLPPLSMRISGPDGIPGPEVVESPRTTSLIFGDKRVRVWVVRIAQEGDYRVDIDGELYGPYKSTLTFGNIMRNQSLRSLLATWATISWVFCICVGGVVFCAVFGIGIGFLAAVGPFLLASTARKLLARLSAESVNRARKFGPEAFSIPCVADRSDHWISGTTASADANERADLRGGTSWATQRHWWLREWLGWWSSAQSTGGTDVRTAPRGRVAPP